MSLDSTMICSNKDFYNQIEISNSSALHKAASEFCETLKKFKVGISKASFRRFISQTLLLSNDMMSEQMQSWASSDSNQNIGLGQAQGDFSHMIQEHPIEIGSIQADSANFKVASSASLKQEDNLATFSHQKINHEQSNQVSHFSQDQAEKSLPSVAFIMKRLNQLNKNSKYLIQRLTNVQLDIVLIQLIKGTNLTEIENTEQKKEIINRFFMTINTAENNVEGIKNNVHQALKCYQYISQEILGLQDSQASQESQWNRICISTTQNFGELITQTLKLNLLATVNKIKQTKKILEDASQKIGQKKMSLKKNETYPAYRQIFQDPYESTSFQHQKIKKTLQNQSQDQLIPGMTERSAQSIKISASLTQQFALLALQCCEDIENARRQIEIIAKQSPKSASEAQNTIKRLNITRKSIQQYLIKSKRYSKQAEESYKQLLVEIKNITTNIYSRDYDWAEELERLKIDADQFSTSAAENDKRANQTAQHALELAKTTENKIKRRNFSPNLSNIRDKPIYSYKERQKRPQLQKQQQIRQQRHQEKNIVFNRVIAASSPTAKNIKKEDKTTF